MTINITLELPVKLANRAKKAGLLRQAALEQLLQRELRRQQTAPRFLTALAKLSASSLPAPTPAEVNAEIKAYRQQKRRKRAGRR